MLKFISILALCLSGHFALCADVPDKGKVLLEARNKYYNLPSHGLLEFRAKVVPDWNVALGSEAKASPSQAKAVLKILRSLHFSTLVRSDGAVTNTHSSDVLAPNPAATKDINQVISGTELEISGFFMTWSAFMLNSPFPSPASDYHLELVGDQYRLRYRESGFDIETTMSKALDITEMKVHSQALTGTVRPRFVDTAEGLILVAYDGETVTNSGASSRLDVVIEYVTVDGLKVPGKIGIQGSFANTPIKGELAFKDYQIRKR